MRQEPSKDEERDPVDNKRKNRHESTLEKRKRSFTSEFIQPRFLVRLRMKKIVYKCYRVGLTPQLLTWPCLVRTPL